MIYGARRGPVDGDDLSEHYPWPDRGGAAYVRALMVSTLDGGAAGPDGLSASITGEPDGAVFGAVRRFADVVLVGGGTMKAERYGALLADPDDGARRREQGQAPAPVIAVVSGSLDLPLEDDGFTGSTVPPIVFTTADPDADRLARLRERCEVVQAEGDEVTVEWVVAQLVARGLWRIVCEGGPSLLRDAAAAGLLDEAALTFSPMLVGTGATPRTEMLGDPARFELAHVLAEDGFLMARYVRGGDDA